MLILLSLFACAIGSDTATLETGTPCSPTWPDYNILPVEAGLPIVAECRVGRCGGPLSWSVGADGLHVQCSGTPESYLVVAWAR